SGVPEAVIKRLEETLEQGLYGRIEIPKDHVFKFEDSYGRSVEIGFVGPEREKILDDARKAGELLKKKIDDYVAPQLEKKGLTDPESDKYKIAKKNLKKEFLQTESGRKLEAILNELEKKVAQEAIERLKTLKQVADGQLKEYEVLNGLLE